MTKYTEKEINSHYAEVLNDYEFTKNELENKNCFCLKAIVKKDINQPCGYSIKFMDQNNNIYVDQIVSDDMEKKLINIDIAWFPGLDNKLKEIIKNYQTEMFLAKLDVSFQKITTENGQQDVQAYIGYNFDTEKDNLIFEIYNNATVNQEFVNFIKENIDGLYLTDHKIQIFQNKLTDWQRWLLTHADVESWSKSPYSNSFYNSKEISWEYKPEGSLRLSDHWNFWSREAVHCVTDDPEFTDGWAVGEYHNGKYQIIKKFND